MYQYSRHYGRHWDRSVSKCDKCHNRGSPERQGTRGRDSGTDSGMERCPRKLNGELAGEGWRTYEEERSRAREASLQFSCSWCFSGSSRELWNWASPSERSYIDLLSPPLCPMPFTQCLRIQPQLWPSSFCWYMSARSCSHFSTWSLSSLVSLAYLQSSRMGI